MRPFVFIELCLVTGLNYLVCNDNDVYCWLTRATLNRIRKFSRLTNKAEGWRQKCYPDKVENVEPGYCFFKDDFRL